MGIHDDTKKVYYMFEDTVEINRSIDEYKSNDTMVNLHSFVREFKTVKDEIFSVSKKL